MELLAQGFPLPQGPSGHMALSLKTLSLQAHPPLLKTQEGLAARAAD